MKRKNKGEMEMNKKKEVNGKEEKNKLLKKRYGKDRKRKWWKGNENKE